MFTIPPDLAFVPRPSVTVIDPYIEGATHRFATPNRRIRKRAMRLALKEPGTVRWMHEALRADDVFVDVGANIGVYSLFAAARVGSGSVYAFEPHVPSFAVLLRNIALNEHARCVVPIGAPLGDRVGWSRFRYLRLKAGSTGSQLEASPASLFLDVEAEELKAVTTIDELVSQGQMAAPNVVKIDVDGHELAVLDGMRATLMNGSVRSLQVEADPERRAQIISRLERAGYGLVDEHYSRQGVRAVARGEVYTPNLVFERRVVDIRAAS